MPTIQELIAAKQKDMQAKKSRASTIKPAEGKHVYRILPTWRKDGDKQFWHDYGQHFIKTPESGNKPAAIYICTEKTYGKPCDVCAAISKLLAVSSDDTTTARLKNAVSTQKYLLNVLHRTSPEPEKVQTLEVGQKVFEAICELITEYNDITDPTSGVDIIIKREGTGLDTKYTVLAAAKSGDVPAAALSQLTNLDDFVAQENQAGEQKALVAVGQIVGIQPPTEKPATSSSKALASMSEEAEDLPFDEVPLGAKRETVLSGSDMDDLDALDELLGDD